MKLSPLATVTAALPREPRPRSRSRRLAARLGALTGLLAILAVGPGRADTLPPLQDYVGTYADGPGRTLELVAGDELFAVEDEAKYRLQRVGPDAFVNAGGQRIAFPRNAAGQVSGFELGGERHARLSTTVAAATVALLRPRPAGQDAPADYHYRPPADLHDGIAVGDIAASDLGLASAEAIVRGVLDGSYPDVDSVLLYQRGHLVLEEYFYGYSAERTHQLRSATKSVVGALAGIAVDRGALPGTDVPVPPLLGYSRLAHADPRKSAITLNDLLTMSSGLDCDDHNANSPGREEAIYERPDWVKAVLDLPLVAEPGRHGAYCSGGVAVVGRATERAVQQPLPDFAQARLFGPLGMARSDWRWNYALDNTNREYAQIHLRPRDMLKFGLLYAQGGRWQGQQLISASWVEASLQRQSEVEGTDYGYFWWRPWLNVPTPRGAQRVTMNAAQGNGGQKIYLVPQYQLVAVFTGSNYNAEGTPPNRIMSRIVLPALIAAAVPAH